ncbi:hypothetical protein CHF27_004275 [Romboutsia maritimum]|uniref:Uncharacterized protein n=1 Tax=Romboutsia maritimum TaxID=2020948 RepID=A0A371IV04_9FIRM|nr:hypothetical protein [Romboutsia maritimum]RDY24306.1 hypothetical protein CHF27_004275 [Romboutsia maritimum]
MENKKLSKIFFILLSIVIIASSNISISNAKEPMMDYKYNLEEQKINRAKFIWKSSLQEMRKKEEFTDKDIKNIEEYMNNSMKSEKLEGRIKKYNREKKVLAVSTVDELVNNNIINKEQGEKLKKRLNKYDLSNLRE